MLHNAAQMSQRQLEQPPEWMNLRGWYSIALTRVMEEEIMAEEALSATQAEFDLYRGCVIRQELFTPLDAAERTVGCAAPASPYVILREE